MSIPYVTQLQCSCNQYPWGKKGSESLAAQLCAKTPGWDGEGPPTKFSIDESKYYSEMWMGTYPVLPSYVKSSGENLQDVIDKHPEELIGKSVLQKFGHSKIPYLPKVLSISKALPLQLHPNKEVAAKLHKEDPQNFTDPNHKPEIALALSKFEAFCGFKPLADIEPLMQLGPLKQFLPSNSSSFSDQSLKHVVRAMLEASDETVEKAVKALQELPESDFGKSSYAKGLIPRLADQYGKTDPGLLVALITMNFLVLQPGECISIPADGIHAYLSGDIIECMARSNNVLNTGFCPKGERNSAELFCKCLTFKPHSEADCKLPGEKYKGSQYGRTTLFAPPMSEFNILATDMKAGDKEVLASVDGPTILIATKGSATMTARGEWYDLDEGNVYFVAPGTELEFETKGGLLMHIAYAE